MADAKKEENSRKKIVLRNDNKIDLKDAKEEIGIEDRIKGKKNIIKIDSLQKKEVKSMIK